MTAQEREERETQARKLCQVGANLIGEGQGELGRALMDEALRIRRGE